MKANELMIGDWVSIKSDINSDDAYWMHDNMHPGQSLKVEEILSGGINPDWYDGEINDYIPEDALMPIPLTQEILEKNGFVFAGDGQMCMMFLSKPQFAEGLRFDIYVGLKRKTIEVFAAHPIERLPNWRKSNKVYLEVCGCFVHELQHALRLCGIEKEIEL